MYRSLSMYPKSAEPAQVAELVEKSTAFFKKRPGFRAASTSVDALMGPGAKDGQYGSVVIVDFDTLDDALGALNADGFQELRAAGEQLRPTHFIFECHEL